MRLWRTRLSLTFQRNGNPYAFLRLGTFAVRLGNGDLGPRFSIMRERTWRA